MKEKCNPKCQNPVCICSVQFSRSVVSNSCNPMNCSTPGLPVHHQLPESTQTHVQWVGDAIQPSPPLSSPSAFNLSQHQGLFKWVSSSNQVARVLEFQLQHQSFQWTPRMISFRMDWLDLPVVQGTLKSLLQHHSSKASICFFPCLQQWKSRTLITGPSGKSLNPSSGN